MKSVAEVEGKPLFDTGAIRPGEHEDVSFDIDLYRKAKGRTAGYVQLKYYADDRKDEQEERGERTFLSAARR